MTRSLGGHQSLKAEVFDVGNGTQLNAYTSPENLCTRGWNGHRVRVQLSAREKNGTLRTVKGPRQSSGRIDSGRGPSLPHPVTQGATITTHAASYVLKSNMLKTLAKFTEDIDSTPLQLKRHRL